MRHYRQGLCVLVLVLITVLHDTWAGIFTDADHSKKYSRLKRQAGDIVLMGYKAQKALKGTTRPSDFFQRIGKNWIGSPGYRDNNIFMRANGILDGMLYDDSND